MQSQNQASPIINFPSLYKDGLFLSRLGNKTISISFGICRDSNNAIDITLGSPNLEGNTVPAPLTLDLTTNGLNGLDTGILQASTMYAIYMIADSRYYLPTGCIATIDTNSSPLMPRGYDSLRLIGYWSTDGSTNLQYGLYSGNGNEITFYYGGQIPVLLGGTATGSTQVPLLPFAPYADNVEVGLQALYTGAAPGNSCVLYNAPIVPGGPNYIIILCQVASVSISEQIVLNTGPVVVGSPYVRYAVSVGDPGLNMYITSFKVSL